MEKISYPQLENLLNVMNEKNVLTQWILTLCKIESLAELNVVQYNYLLMIIKN